MYQSVVMQIYFASDYQNYMSKYFYIIEILYTLSKIYDMQYFKREFL